MENSTGNTQSPQPAQETHKVPTSLWSTIQQNWDEATDEIRACFDEASLYKALQDEGELDTVQSVLSYLEDNRGLLVDLDKPITNLQAVIAELEETIDHPDIHNVENEVEVVRYLVNALECLQKVASLDPTPGGDNAQAQALPTSYGEQDLRFSVLDDLQSITNNLRAVVQVSEDQTGALGFSMFHLDAMNHSLNNLEKVRKHLVNPSAEQSETPGLDPSLGDFVRGKAQDKYGFIADKLFVGKVIALGEDFVIVEHEVGSMDVSVLFLKICNWDIVNNFHQVNVDDAGYYNLDGNQFSMRQLQKELADREEKAQAELKACLYDNPDSLHGSSAECHAQAEFDRLNEKAASDDAELAAMGIVLNDKQWHQFSRRLRWATSELEDLIGGGIDCIGVMREHGCWAKVSALYNWLHEPSRQIIRSYQRNLAILQRAVSYFERIVARDSSPDEKKIYISLKNACANLENAQTVVDNLIKPPVIGDDVSAERIDNPGSFVHGKVISAHYGVDSYGVDSSFPDYVLVDQGIEQSSKVKCRTDNIIIFATSPTHDESVDQVWEEMIAS